MGTKKKSTFGNEEFAILIYTQNYERTSVEAKKENVLYPPPTIFTALIFLYTEMTGV